MKSIAINEQEQAGEKTGRRSLLIERLFAGTIPVPSTLELGMKQSVDSCFSGPGNPNFVATIFVGLRDKYI